MKPILLEPLPYPEAHRITMIWEVRPDGVRADGTFGMYRGLLERAHSFEEIAVFKTWQPVLTKPDEPERLNGQRVSASYFQVLGVSVVLALAFILTRSLWVVIIAHFAFNFLQFQLMRMFFHVSG